MMRIDVRIDRVVLEGLSMMPSCDREIRDALETELAKLIAATPRSVWTQSQKIRAVRGVSLAATAHTPIGSAAARALHRVLAEGRHR